MLAYTSMDLTLRLCRGSCNPPEGSTVQAMSLLANNLTMIRDDFHRGPIEGLKTAGMLVVLWAYFAAMIVLVAVVADSAIRAWL